MDIELNIKKLRTKRKITQRNIADNLGIPRSTFSQYETGARAIPDDIKIKIADFFGVSLDYLLGREEEFTGLNIIERPLDPPKTEIQIAYDAMNERQRNKLLDYARGMLASEDIDLDELLRHNLK